MSEEDNPFLVHSTYRIENVWNILKEGILPSTQTNKRGHVPAGFSDKIFLMLLPGFSRYENVTSTWGRYHFVINDDFARDNADQFRFYGDGFDRRGMLKKFMERHGIREYGEDEERSCIKAVNQFISLKPIPVEGIEYLIFDAKNSFGDEDEEEMAREGNIRMAKLIVPDHIRVIAKDRN